MKNKYPSRHNHVFSVGCNAPQSELVQESEINSASSIYTKSNFVLFDEV